MRYALASVGHPVPTVKFLGAKPLSPRDMSVRITWFWVGRNSGPSFRRLWTKVHQIWQACTWVIAVYNYNAIFRLTISYSSHELFANRDPVAKLSEISPKFWCFGTAKFVWGGTPKFLAHVYKLQSPSNMWQSLVTIGPETSKIRRRKKEDIETYLGKI